LDRQLSAMSVRLRTVICLVVVAACAGGPRYESVRYTNTPNGGADVRQVSGRAIGDVRTVGDVVVLELDAGVISDAHLFDLEARTLRFTPDGNGYRVQNLPLSWQTDVGDEIREGIVELSRFSFPFSGKQWTSLTVNPLGNITFGGTYADLGLPRFIHLEKLGPELVGTLPMISAFLKPRMRGSRYASERADRLIVTWDLTEPFGGNQDMTFERTPHRFQAVLHADGAIDLSYQVVTTRDAIVGVFPVPGGAATEGSTDLSSADSTRALRGAIYEAFHHYGLPRPESLACTVIRALGDNFDFMVWYSDFRVDDQEAGTRSVGDIGQRVDGLGPRMDIGQRLHDFCSAGRLQVTWYQPVYIESNQAQERAPDGRWTNYNNAVAQIAHELGHRWSTRTKAIVNGDTIELRAPHDPWGMSGATHWPAGLHTPVPFPYGSGPEASIMGGSQWQDNGDGTFTLLDRGSMVPADGFSYLELYLMGFLPPDRVPDFFLLRDAQPAGRDSAGRPRVTAARVNITIRDVIAHNGPRVPAFEEAQKEFRTALVAVVLNGRTPSAELLARTEAIGRAWVDYWSRVTGGAATMSTRPVR
jgi:hypothetical protein